MALLKLHTPAKKDHRGDKTVAGECEKNIAGKSKVGGIDLSCLPMKESVIENGKYAGKTFADYVRDNGRRVLGKNCEGNGDFFAISTIGDNCFTVDKVSLSGSLTTKLSGTVDNNSFLHINIIDGQGEIRNGCGGLIFTKGDNFFLSAGSSNFEICGKCEALLITEKIKY